MWFDFNQQLVINVPVKRWSIFSTATNKNIVFSSSTNGGRAHRQRREILYMLHISSVVDRTR